MISNLSVNNKKVMSRLLTRFSAARNGVRLQFPRRGRIRIGHFTANFVERNGICDGDLGLVINVVLVDVCADGQRSFGGINCMMGWRQLMMRMTECIGCHCAILIRIRALFQRLQLLTIPLLAVI